MWRLIKFLFTGDGHLHKWTFTRADFFRHGEEKQYGCTRYVKVCEICGIHKAGVIEDCWAKTADELNP